MGGGGVLRGACWVVAVVAPRLAPEGCAVVDKESGGSRGSPFCRIFKGGIKRAGAECRGMLPSCAVSNTLLLFLMHIGGIKYNLS